MVHSAGMTHLRGPGRIFLCKWPLHLLFVVVLDFRIFFCQTDNPLRESREQ
jgi:hypothetical protein